MGERIEHNYFVLAKRERERTSERKHYATKITQTHVVRKVYTECRVF